MKNWLGYLNRNPNKQQATKIINKNQGLDSYQHWILKNDELQQIFKHYQDKVQNTIENYELAQHLSKIVEILQVIKTFIGQHKKQQQVNELLKQNTQLKKTIQTFKEELQRQRELHDLKIQQKQQQFQRSLFKLKGQYLDLQSQNKNLTLNLYTCQQALKKLQEQRVIKQIIQPQQRRIEKNFLLSVMRKNYRCLFSFLSRKQISALKAVDSHYHPYILLLQTQRTLSFEKNRFQRQVLNYQRQIQKIQNLAAKFEDDNTKFLVVKYFHHRIKPGQYIVKFLNQLTDVQRQAQQDKQWEHILGISRNKSEHRKNTSLQVQKSEVKSRIQQEISRSLEKLFRIKDNEDLSKYSSIMSQTLQQIKRQIGNKQQFVQLQCFSKYLYQQMGEIYHLLLTIFGMLYHCQRQIEKLENSIEDSKEQSRTLKNLIEQLNRQKKQSEQKLWDQMSKYTQLLQNNRSLEQANKQQSLMLQQNQKALKNALSQYKHYKQKSQKYAQEKQSKSKECNQLKKILKQLKNICINGVQL